VINTKNTPTCSDTECPDVEIRSVNTDGTVTITTLTSTLNEASIQTRPFSVVLFRQLTDVQKFLINSENDKPDATTPAKDGTASEKNPEVTVMTSADDTNALEGIQSSGDKIEQKAEDTRMVLEKSKTVMKGVQHKCSSTMVQVVKVVACIPKSALAYDKECVVEKRVHACYRMEVCTSPDLDNISKHRVRCDYEHEALLAVA